MTRRRFRDPAKRAKPEHKINCAKGMDEEQKKKIKKSRGRMAIDTRRGRGRQVNITGSFYKAVFFLRKARGVFKHGIRGLISWLGSEENNDLGGKGLPYLQRIRRKAR